MWSCELEFVPLYILQSGLDCRSSFLVPSLKHEGVPESISPAGPNYRIRHFRQKVCSGCTVQLHVVQLAGQSCQMLTSQEYAQSVFSPNVCDLCELIYSRTQAIIFEIQRSEAPPPSGSIDFSLVRCCAECVSEQAMSCVELPVQMRGVTSQGETSSAELVARF